MDEVMISNKLVQHDEQIKTLFKQQEEIKILAETVSELGKSTMILAESVKAIKSDVDELKEARKYKIRQIWTTIATGVISAVVGYLMALVLR